MTSVLTETPKQPPRKYEFAKMPPVLPGRPVAEEPVDPMRCGVCGEEKVKLPMGTKKLDLPIYVCINIPVKDHPFESKGLPCDGFAYKNAVFSYSDYDA